MYESSFSHRTLGDLIDANEIQVTTGFPFGGHNSNGDGEVHIRPFNVGTDGSIHLDQIKSIPFHAASEKPRLQKGDIVFNNTNTKELAGKCALWTSDEELVFSNHMTRIRLLENSIDPAYLSFAIFHHWMIGKSEMLARSHVAQASIIGARFREIEVPWPRADEQKSIGQLLSHVQVARRTEASQHELARKLKTATMRNLFTRGMRGELQKETEIGLAPGSWEIVQLGTLGKIGNGSTPKKTQPEYWVGGFYPWLTSAKVYDREITSADQFVTDTALAKCHLPRVKPGAVLMAITGQGKTLGHCAVLTIEATVSQHVAYLQTDTSKANPSFVRGYLETQYEYLRQVASGGGSTKGALTCAFLKSLHIPLPDLAEQQEIVTILDSIDRKISLHQQRESVLDELFRSLLNKLMTGEVTAEEIDTSVVAPREPRPKIGIREQS
ncbi:restriction endonuclease subunit S [Rhodoferax sp.]|uniref:restriction endonuclease subunit S n=1 Tax=Rhodoferax sp. TaxID=50421 RepID=UPI0025CDF7B9|nr:restriction endonuclease subunit S [Rhodoferax sp.]